MRDPLTFARLISQITNLRGSCLDEYEIKPISETIDRLAVGASADTVNRLLAAMRDGRKIEAIKEYRTLTGLGLKESKDTVEAYWLTGMQHPVTFAAE